MRTGAIIILVGMLLAGCTVIGNSLIHITDNDVINQPTK